LYFIWIQGHAGNYGNELADNLAKEGARSHRSFDYDLMPVSYVKRIFFDKTIELWNDRWLNATTGSATRTFIPSIRERARMKKYFKPNFYLTQFLTNDGKFSE
jgi:hypothetical protein